jgi:GAF domain-containing protein
MSPTGTAAGRDATADSGGLADRLSELARTLQRKHDMDDTLQAIVAAAVATVPGAQHASISSVRGKRIVTTLASTDDLPQKTDQAQYDTGEGPCLDALYDRDVVRLDDLATETRWPEFTRRVSELGMRSMMCLQLYVEGDDLGALNLLSEQAGSFDDDSEQTALLFASHAAVAMADAGEQENLRRALGQRDLIGQAKGILMERFGVDGDHAFSLLARASQATNRKLTAIAEELVGTRDLPQKAAPPARSARPR